MEKDKKGIIPNNVVRIPIDKGNVFRYWLEFLAPLHHLTEREMDVATALLQERYNLSKVITDSNLLERILMSEDTHKKIKQEYGLSNQHFQVIKSKLKSKNFLVDNKINPRLIPTVKEDQGSFLILILFDLQ